MSLIKQEAQLPQRNSASAAHMDRGGLGKKRLRISTNGLYCQKLELLTYIFVADSMGLCSLVFMQLCFEVKLCESKTASAQTEFYVN